MTVAEFIEWLKQFDQTLEVKLYNAHEYWDSPDCDPDIEDGVIKLQ